MPKGCSLKWFCYSAIICKNAVLWYSCSLKNRSIFCHISYCRNDGIFEKLSIYKLGGMFEKCYTLLWGLYCTFSINFFCFNLSKVMKIVFHLLDYNTIIVSRTANHGMNLSGRNTEQLNAKIAKINKVNTPKGNSSFSTSFVLFD